ncbi:hypothetical protein HYH02_007121 [Chlamydomonas schloesseri]|uniref:Uncharacterized protein n=1 Tax=Chlamydomonas schloesseri TaxID=2026947 RepID=A0A835WIQ1_9CHLO|nr:hypothetical protein HYH02_007121 [Chlamydomonas schloesseri]|eukprot:KAG2448097.1 hypothetical protein HYH02_007121 [Chlamydomonas schloesseri]
MERPGSPLGRTSSSKPSILAGFGAARSVQDLCSLAAAADAAAAAAAAATEATTASSGGGSSESHTLVCGPLHTAGSGEYGVATATGGGGGAGSAQQQATSTSTTGLLAINRRRSLDSACRSGRHPSRHAPRPRHDYATSCSAAAAAGRGGSRGAGPVATAGASTPATATGISTAPSLHQPPLAAASAGVGLLSLPQPLLQRILLSVPGGPGRDGDWEEGWSPAAATAEERAAAAAAALTAAVTAGGDCGVVCSLMRLVPAGGRARAELDRVMVRRLGRSVGY